MQPFKKERHQLENTASKLLSLCQQAGMDSAEVCASYSQKTKVNLEKQDFHLASTDDSFQVGLRVIKDGCQGFSYCNTVEPKDLKSISTRAAELAKLSPPNPNYSIRESENIPKEAPSEFWDESLHQTSLQTQKEWAKFLLKESTKDSRFRLNDGSVVLTSGLFLVANSAGTHKIEKETTAAWSLMGMGVDGNSITSFDYFSSFVRHVNGIPEKIVDTTRRFCAEVLNCLRQGPAKSYSGSVVFSPRAVIDILISPLLFHFNGRNVLEKMARWQLKDLHKQILSVEISLKDVPWLTDRTGCAVFDREGTPTKQCQIIDKGRLQTFLLDHYAAKGLSLSTTGHAVGGPSGPPSAGSHTICMEGGKIPREKILQDLSKKQTDFLLVNRFSGQTDPVTGDFSGVAKGGEWWHAGERVYSIKETLLSGNLFDLLGELNEITLSQETEIVDCSEEAPTIILAPVSVTAA